MQIHQKPLPGAPAVDVSPPIACHGGTRGSLFRLIPYSSSFVFRTQVESKEREHMFLVSTNLLQDSIGKDRVYFNRADYMSVGQDMI